MISFARFFMLYESFDTVSDFLLNPEHRDKRFSDLMKEFESSGGRQIGQGKYGTVYSHPKWPYVIKTFTRDDNYLKFVRFAYKNSHSAFPKFYGPPKKIVPYYTRELDDMEMYISRIEKLKPLDEGEYDKINNARHKLTRYFIFKNPENIPKGYEDIIRKEMIGLKQYVADLPKEIYKVLEGLEMLEGVMKKEEWSGSPDWHNGNIMKRSNGEYVLIDPIWEGYEFNAYRDHDEAVRREIGYYDDEDPNYVAPDPTPIRGGELPKKKRVKKKKVVPVPLPEPEVYSSDDIPF